MENLCWSKLATDDRNNLFPNTHRRNNLTVKMIVSVNSKNPTSLQNILLLIIIGMIVIGIAFIVLVKLNILFP